MIRNSLSVINQKGGVGKTSLASHVAGLAALSGWRVLLVEMDRQGNLSRDLGVMDRSDRGQSLYRAVMDNEPLQPMVDVRPGLDYVAGGDYTAQLYRAFDGLDDGVPRYHLLRGAVEPLADNYDLTIFDCPPGEELAQMAVLVSTRFVLCPTKSDLGSIDGLTGVLRLAANVRKLYNPDLELLGAVLMMVGKGSRQVLRHAREEIEQRSGSRIRLYEPPIRAAEAVASECRRRGLLVHEVEEAATAQKQKRLAELRRRKQGSSDAPLPSMPNANGLAEDYQELTRALLADIADRLSGETP